jgi:hypothetical protein
LVVGLEVSHFSLFAPVISSKNEGLVGEFDIVQFVPFDSPRGQFQGYLTKAQENKHFAGALPDFGLNNLLTA